MFKVSGQMSDIVFIYQHYVCVCAHAPLCLFSREKQGSQGRRVLQGREVDLGSLVVEVTTPRMHSQ